MVTLKTRKEKGRIREIKNRRLLIKPHGLKILRETQLRDAFFLDHKGRRVYCPGELRSVYTGLAEANYLINHGTTQQKMRAIKLRKQFEEMERSIRYSMGQKRISCPSDKVLKEIKEQVAKEVDKKHVKIKPDKFESAKQRFKAAREK